jgi:hypothetical protein
VCKFNIFCAANSSCFTNHALDQFLEHLLPITKRIVRMGAMSKSEKLEKYNLYEWVNGQEDGTKTRIEKGMEYAAFKALESQQQDGNTLCELLCNGANVIQWDQLADLLRREYPNHYEQFIGGIDDDGFIRPGRKRGNFFKYWKFGTDLKDRKTYQNLYGAASTETRTPSRSVTELLSSNADIWDFSRTERALVLGHWESELRQDWIDELVVRAENYGRELEKLDTVRSEYNRRLLERVDVIGLTTTGLARHAPLLNRVEAKTLICEEAGEVLEVCSP